MKYYPDPCFRVVTAGRYTNLFRYLFGHYDRFYKEVVGGDFEKSIYRRFQYPTPEYEYKAYRRKRAYEYKQARKMGYPYKVKALVPFDRFKKGFVEPKIDAELSTLRLFIQALHDIFCRESIVHDRKGMCFKAPSNWDRLFINTLTAIISERLPHIKTNSSDRNPFTCPSYTPYPEESDFRKPYEFIFRLLRSRKLLLKYGEISRKDMDQLFGVLNKIWYESQIEDILNSKAESTLSEDDYELLLQNREAAAKQEDIKNMMRQMEIPQIVEAYYNVYGEFPANYPVVD